MSTKLKIGIGVIIVLGGLAYISNNDNPSKKFSTSTVDSGKPKVKKGKISQEAYWKQNKNRIFVFSISSGTPVSQIKKHAKKQMNTSGKMTACYYFMNGTRIPRDGVTLANNMGKANEVINRFSDGIEYAYMKAFNGTSEFVNCRTNPSNGLCAQN